MAEGGKPGMWTAMGAVGTLLGGVAAVATMAKVWFDASPDTASQTTSAEIASTPNEEMRRAVGGQDAQLESLVRGYLDMAQQRQGQGLSPAAGLHDEVTSLRAGMEHSWQIRLNAGQSYRIVGGCDNECTDLDLALVDSGGAVAAIDNAANDFPVLSVTPAESGRYVVLIRMAGCTAEPCYAGARVLTRR
jgi:hypothetical protein